MKIEFHNINIEKVVLINYILKPSLFNSSPLKSDIFFLEFHRKLFQTLQKLNEQNLQFDKLIIQSKIGEDAKNSFFNELNNENIKNNIKDFENILIEYYQKRVLSKNLQNINLEMNKDLSIEKIKALLLQEIQNLDNFTSKDKLFEIEAINEIIEEKTEFICDDWLPIPKRTVSIISAQGGIGKSWAAIQLGLRHLMKNPNEKVYAWLSEDPKGLSKNRAKSICSEILKKNLNDFSNLQITGLECEPFHIVNDNGTINEKFEIMKNMLKDFNVIILDPLIAFYSGNENDNVEARIFMQVFTKWANRENKTIIFIHHKDKQGKNTRGASSIIDAVRSIYEIEEIENNEIERKFTLKKDNYGISNILKGSTINKIILPKKHMKGRR